MPTPSVKAGPCKFCGSPKTHVTNVAKAICVMCDNCGATGPKVMSVKPHSKDSSMWTYQDPAVNKAIDLWNGPPR